jgi:hypothetical protein
LIVLILAVAAIAAIFICGIIALHDTPERREERRRRHLPTRSAKDLAEASVNLRAEASGPAGLEGPRNG